MARRPIQLHPQAVTEAQAAYRWYRDRNPIAAEAFLAELDRATEQVSENPLRWPVYRQGTRRFLLRRFPFAVVYREVGEVVQIVAVAHGRRKPGYWQGR